MKEDTSFVHRFGSTSLVDQITFAGLERTKIHTILREFDEFEYFDSIQDVYEALEEVHRALMSLDAFEAVDIVIDESYQVSCLLQTFSTCTMMFSYFGCRIMRKFQYQ